MDVVQEIAVAAIVPSRTNPRTCFDEGKLNELALSIKQSGVIQPLLVRRLTEDTFELIAGERRWRASQRAGLNRVPCVVRDITEAQLLEAQIVENSQREDVNSMDEARALLRVREVLQIDVAEIAERIGKSEPYVYNMLQLCKCPDEVQEIVYRGGVSKGVAWQIMRLKDPRQQIQAARDLARSGDDAPRTSERSAKYYIRHHFGDSAQSRARKASDAKDVRYGKQPTNFYVNWKWFLVRFSDQQFQEWKRIVRGRTDNVTLAEAVEGVMLKEANPHRPISYKDPVYTNVKAGLGSVVASLGRQGKARPTLGGRNR